MKDNELLQLMFSKQEKTTTTKQALCGTVPENVDVANAIAACMKEYKCWIFISDELLTRLKNQHKDHYPYNRIASGIILQITNPNNNWTVYITKGSVWHKVSLLLDKRATLDKQPLHLENDPELVIFLS